uniref:cytochrome b n=1 Tax=Stigmaeopsis nanjingensis TaxID=486490 RepID=UPI00286C939E|nr:cytochrome b [Stigmaeopsis nanjingensis]WKW93591.1 cytochrome b [Stigmaeopsis nanjingensis]
MKKIFSSVLGIPTPSNISLMWNFGSLLGLSMFMQVLSGFFISMHYVSNIDLSFMSYIFMGKLISNGLILQLFHAHFSSIIFVIMYIHILKSLLNKSFNKIFMWVTGNIMLLLIMMSAFLGYVLPWGQMSFWGATVITNILSSIPYIGLNLTSWVWGGFSVDNATLNRFFSLHFLVPFLVLFLSMIHLNILHIKGSSNQMGVYSNVDKLYFGKSFFFKDFVSLFMLMFFYFFVLMLYLDQHYSMAKENFFPADPLNTPLHIKPEWYFMFAYALLRSVPSKIGGILSLALLFLLFLLLMFNSSLYSKFFFFKKVVVSLLIFLFLILTNLGYKMIEYPFTEMSLFSGVFLMFMLFIL